MHKIFTEDDIVRYIYNEVSPTERKEIEKALEKSTHLQKVHSQLTEIILRMDAVQVKPHPSSIELILEHSKTSSHLEASL